jgi:hypothetical protein
MTSKDVINYLNVEGMDKLYKKFEKYFLEVDTWADRFATGDLLNEYELSQALDRMTGIFIRFHIIAEAIDSYKTNQELSYKVKAFKEAEAKDKKPTISQIEEEARASTKELRTYRSDFLSYSEGCEKAIITCQARIKRLTIESGAKGINFTGDMSQPAVQQKQAEEKKDIGWNS